LFFLHFQTQYKTVMEQSAWLRVTAAAVALRYTPVFLLLSWWVRMLHTNQCSVN